MIAQWKIEKIEDQQSRSDNTTMNSFEVSTMKGVLTIFSTAVIFPLLVVSAVVLYISHFGRMNTISVHIEASMRRAAEKTSSPP